MRDQLDIFGAPPAPALPDGFRYQPDLLSPDEEEALDTLEALLVRFRNEPGWDQEN